MVLGHSKSKKMKNSINDFVFGLIVVLIIIIGMIIIANINQSKITAYQEQLEYLRIENKEMKSRILELQNDKLTITIEHERCMNFIARHQITRDY